jgi:hypothetical protein
LVGSTRSVQPHCACVYRQALVKLGSFQLKSG